MYVCDDKDEVLELRNLPQSDVGAPLPVLCAAEHHLCLAFIVSEPDPEFDGTTVQVVGPDTEDKSIAVVSFARHYAHMLGPPNDEAFEGHPLAGRGLRPYAIFEVRNSSWIRRLEGMNQVHPSHSAEPFQSYRHFIFAFHDSTFECMAEDYSVSVRRGSIESVLTEIAKTFF